jgi:hypothetical protein
VHGGRTDVGEEILADVAVFVLQVLKHDETGDLHENLGLSVLQLIFELLVLLDGGFEDV